MSKLEIRPFNDYWLNCTFNNFFSILTSYKKEYSELAYLNCYTYEAYNEWCPKHITINNFGQIQKDTFSKMLSETFFSYEYSEYGVKKIIDLLDTNNILIRVDLFNWLPNSPSWHIVHNYHVSLLIGYNKFENTFIVIDDDNMGYGIRTIPYDRFISCIKDEAGKISGSIIEICDDVEYELNMNDVLYNAEVLSENLKVFLDEDDFWSVQKDENGEDLYKYYAFELFKVKNRHIANLSLMNCLFDKHYISRDELTQMEIIFVELIEEWDTIKNIFMKHSYSSSQIDIKKMNKMKRRCINKELEIWERVRLLK